MAAVASSFNTSEKQLIESSLKKFQIMSTAVARLYLAFPDRNTWTYKFLGAITVVYDNAGSYYLKLLDIQKNGEVLWEFPISKEIKYKEECDFFHIFYTDKSAAGLSFADENEAKSFFRCVIQYMNQSQIPKSTKRASTFTGPTTIVPSSESNKDGKKKKGSKSKTGKKSKSKIDKSMISGPKDFKHTLHMGAESFSDFSESDNAVIEEAFKIMSGQRNVTKEQFMNSKDLQFIAEFLSKNNNSKPASSAPIQSITIQSQPPPQPLPQQSKSNRAAPPPPPTSKRAAPPPPPTRSRAAPPPPPSRSRAAPPPPPSRSSDKSVPPPPSRAAPPVPSRSAAPPVPAREAAPPPLPSREAAPPPLPSREAAPPPLPSRSAPVPPPPAGGPPPPPPPPGPITPYRTEDPDSPPKSRPVSDNDGRSDLLASIRNAGISSLKPASQRQVKQIEAPAESANKNDLASALAMALLKRKDDMNDEDTEESSDEDDDDEDDSEWSD